MLHVARVKKFREEKKPSLIAGGFTKERTNRSIRHGEKGAISDASMHDAQGRERFRLTTPSAHWS